MKDNINKNIAILSMVRNDNFFISKWIDYYGQRGIKKEIKLVKRWKEY